MKKLKLAEVKGFASLIVLGGMLLVAVALPIATKLVQQNQENRSSAASSCTSANVGKKYCSGSSILECKCTNTSYGTCVSWGWKTAVSCGTKGCASGSTSCYECSNDSHCSGSKKCVNHKCVSKVDGKCGTADGNTYSSKPTTNLCSKGSTTWLDENGYGGYYDWRCNGSNGGSSVKCSAKKKANSPVNGKCGSANGGTFDSKPTSGICSSGSSDWTDDKGSDGTWNWKCKGSNNGTDASCSAKCEKRSYWYYDSSSKSCKSNSDYASITACEVSRNKCYESESTCKSAVFNVSGIVLDRKSVSLVVGSYADIKVTVLPATATNKNVAWSTGNSSIATVSVGGRITGVKVGATKITAKASNGKTATVSVKVTASSNSFGYYWNGSDCVKSALSCGSSSWPSSYGTCYSSEDKCRVAYSINSFGYYWNGSACVKSALSCGSSSWPKEYGTCYSSQSYCESSDHTNDPSGSQYSSTSPSCKKLGGLCVTYSKALSTGDRCRVNGIKDVVGKVKTGICPGSKLTVCCTGITGSSSSGGSTSGGSSSGGGNNGGGNNDTTVAVTGITLNPPSLSLKVGQSQAITATVAPADATDTTVTWSSDKATVAEVGSATGLVTAKGVGTAIITAKTSNNKTATASVTVVAASTTTTGSPKISFKFTLRGVKPSYIGKDGKAYDCFSKLGNLKVDVVNSPTNTYQTGLAATFAPVANEVNSKGDQVFKVTALALDGKFSSVSNFNYVKIKGPFHVKRRMCNDGQTSKIPETTVCDVSLMSDKVYDFTNYTLLAGDIDGDGIVNSIDYSVVKRNFNADADILCGREGDLNMDGVVNWIDGNLISKESLSSRDDE